MADYHYLPLQSISGKSLSAKISGGAFHVSPHRFAARENELQINRLTSGQT